MVATGLDLVTYEFENVPVSTAHFLEQRSKQPWTASPRRRFYLRKTPPAGLAWRLNEKSLGGKDKDSKTINVGGLRNDSGSMILIAGDATRGGGLARLPVNSSTAPRTGTLLAMC